MIKKPPTTKQARMIADILKVIGKATPLDAMNALYMAMQVVDLTANGVRTPKEKDGRDFA